MSKTSQRKQQLFHDGRMDALKGEQQMWDKHPYIDSYKAGYTQGTQERKAKELRSTL